MNPFPAIHIEISGVCNAKCPYCISGNGSQPQGGFIDLPLFRAVLQKLLDTGLAKPDQTMIALYNWGEPFLHPKFLEIVKIINEYGLKYGISTNASVIPEITSEFTQNLKLALISMPGFSQKSYDRIHGFQFSLIKENIEKLVTGLHHHGYRGECRVSYHVYQFNLDEMLACEEFCKYIGVNFYPYYAILLDWWQIVDYLHDQLPVAKLKSIGRDLFLEFMEASFKNPIEDGPCSLLTDYLVINEYGTVVTCCNLPTNHPDYACGNLLEDPIDEILKARASKPACAECTNLRIFSGSVNIPTFYYQMARNLT